MAKKNFLLSALLLLCACTGVASFSAHPARTATSLSSAALNGCPSRTGVVARASSSDRDPVTRITRKNEGGVDAFLASVPAFLALATATVMTSLPALAEGADDYEISELPPVYVPILFAIAVIGGVGVLTWSLGNVMDEEASLGLQSGARAKKERDRSRSSYFKK